MVEFSRDVVTRDKISRLPIYENGTFGNPILFGQIAQREVLLLEMDTRQVVAGCDEGPMALTCERISLTRDRIRNV